jgi:protein TonB
VERTADPLPVKIAVAPAIDATALGDYGLVVSRALAQRKSYPPIARMRNWQGTTELKLAIGSEGDVTDVTVSKGSGFSVLDDQALKMVKESLPLPRVPDALQGRQFSIRVPVVFKLQGS